MSAKYIVESFGPPIPDMGPTDLCDLSLGFSGLRLAVLIGRDEQENDLFVEIVFTTIRGFRYLDEGDLLFYWRSGAFDTANYLVFEIKAGGWAEQEVGNGMLDTTAAVGAYREWFIVSGNACVNVISVGEPLIRFL